MMMMMLVHRFHQLRPTLTPAATTSLAAAETTFFEIRSAMISLWNRQERERERETEIMSVPFFLPSFYETMESFSTVVGQEKRHLVFVVVVVSFPFLLSDVFLLFRFFFCSPPPVRPSPRPPVASNETIETKEHRTWLFFFLYRTKRCCVDP